MQTSGFEITKMIRKINKKIFIVGNSSCNFNLYLKKDIDA